ncbi:MAG TPA: hypothetical protein VI547_01890, partial [Anaerolineales bacterium]|nr:hypothetical protein [Anaerolineales bacterium]
GQTIALGAPLNANLAGGLTLLSAEFPPSVASGADFDASLYLTAREHTEQQYRPRFDLISPDGLLWNNGNEALPPRWHREPPETSQWPLGQYAQWARRQTILPGTPPGDYKLTVTVFDRASLAPDSIVDENGNALSPVIALGTIRVTRPAAPPALADLNIEHQIEHDFGPLTLLGYNLDRAEARPGDNVLITLFLRANNSITNYQLPVTNYQFNLFTPPYPTSLWQPGDIWRFQTLQRIPADTASGPFRFNLSLADTESLSLDLAPIHLTAPDRIFTPPSIATPTSIHFGNSIELSGYEIKITNNQLLITLLWYALATPNADLLAFIHIEDSSGRVVAQSDSVPANWSRPTTGWIRGEYILDPRSLPILPTGEYNLFVGLADRLSGARLSTPDGDRALIGVYKAP